MQGQHMEPMSHRQELHHEIFGSVLDRAEMTPFLLLRTANYTEALGQATRMMGNRGFDIVQDELQASEKDRAQKYIEQVYRYFLHWLFPFVRSLFLLHRHRLLDLKSKV